MNLVNKTIVITGASGGIGSETAKLLSHEHSNLILVGRNQPALEKLLSEIQAGANHSKAAHRCVVADLSKSEGRQAVFDAAKDADALINLAGVNQLAMFSHMTDKQIATMISSNLTVPMLLSKGMLPILLGKPESALINVGSILGSIGMPGSTAYCASKFGLRGFTESLRRELADTSIRVSYLAPRATQTAMNNTQAMALNEALGNQTDSPQLVATAIVDVLKGSKSKRKYLGWPEKLFVRINAVFPNLVDGSLSKQLNVVKKFTQ